MKYVILVENQQKGMNDEKMSLLHHHHRTRIRVQVLWILESNFDKDLISDTDTWACPKTPDRDKLSLSNSECESIG